jgi:hypothetical protein
MANLELDANGDGAPDSWNARPEFTRTIEQVHSGTYAGRHRATNDATYTVCQDVSGITPGQSYTFRGWVYIPPSSDTFKFKHKVAWRDANGAVISDVTVKRYFGATTGWDLAARTASPRPAPFRRARSST